MTVPSASRFRRYLTVILRWLAIGFVVCVLTLMVGNYITENLLTKVYTASAMLQVPPGDLVIPTEGSRPEPVAFQPEFENIIRSPDFLLTVIKDLGLDKTWAKQASNADPSSSDQDQLPDGDALTRMEKLLRFHVAHGTNIIEIIVSSDAPTEAADIANAVADRYKAVRDIDHNQRNGKGLAESPVRILSRAEVPTVPTRPNKSFAFVVTMVVAGFLSLMAASFVEIILLFLRAGEREGN